MAKKTAKPSAKSTSQTKAAAPVKRTLPKSTKTSAIQSTSRHTYMLVLVPDDCTNYEVGQQVDIYVNDPPPTYVQINAGGQCNQMVGKLDE